jgi:hypothetical protein
MGNLLISIQWFCQATESKGIHRDRMHTRNEISMRRFGGSTWGNHVENQGVKETGWQNTDWIHRAWYREAGQLVSFCELGNESLDPLNECQIHNEDLMVLTTCRVRSAASSWQTFILLRGDIATLNGSSNSHLSWSLLAVLSSHVYTFIQLWNLIHWNSY